jgi:uncharacterized protein DUF3800
MLSQAFIDESGDHDKPSFVLGGYIAGAEEWTSFSDDWQAVLNDDPPWPALHMAPCSYAKDPPWSDFNREVRDAKLLQLIAVIEKHNPAAFIATMDVAEFKGPRAEESRSISDGHPYLMAAATLISALLNFHEDRRRDFGKIEFIFDTKDKYFRRHVRADIEEDLIPLLRAEAPHLLERLGEIYWPRPDEKANFVPLQAADMLVWHWRRGRDQDGGRNSQSWRALRRISKPRLLKFPGDGELGRIFSARL